jgi:uncharacterized protein YndB with AHSA1/START domain
VTVETSVRAPVETVWRLLTVERDAWWPEMRFEPVVGAPLVETWTEDGRPASASGTVTRCDEPHLLEFRWRESGWRAPLEVTIRISSGSHSTSVTLHESGFSRAQTPSSLADEHEQGWLYHLERWRRASESHVSPAT